MLWIIGILELVWIRNFKMKDIPHICVVCGVSVMKSVLARHMKIHDEIAQFRCEICDKNKRLFVPT